MSSPYSSRALFAKPPNTALGITRSCLGRLLLLEGPGTDFFFLSLPKSDPFGDSSLPTTAAAPSFPSSSSSSSPSPGSSSLAVVASISFSSSESSSSSKIGGSSAFGKPFVVALSLSDLIELAMACFNSSSSKLCWEGREGDAPRYSTLLLSSMSPPIETSSSSSSPVKSIISAVRLFRICRHAVPYTHTLKSPQSAQVYAGFLGN